MVLNALIMGSRFKYLGFPTGMGNREWKILCFLFKCHLNIIYWTNSIINITAEVILMKRKKSRKWCFIIYYIMSQFNNPLGTLDGEQALWERPPGLLLGRGPGWVGSPGSQARRENSAWWGSIAPQSCGPKGRATAPKQPALGPPPSLWKGTPVSFSHQWCCWDILEYCLRFIEERNNNIPFWKKSILLSLKIWEPRFHSWKRQSHPLTLREVHLVCR